MWDLMRGECGGNIRKGVEEREEDKYRGRVEGGLEALGKEGREMSEKERSVAR